MTKRMIRLRRSWILNPLLYQGTLPMHHPRHGHRRGIETPSNSIHIANRNLNQKMRAIMTASILSTTLLLVTMTKLALVRLLRRRMKQKRSNTKWLLHQHKGEDYFEADDQTLLLNWRMLSTKLHGVQTFD
jgi:hypothetical protein